MNGRKIYEETLSQLGGSACRGQPEPLIEHLGVDGGGGAELAVRLGAGADGRSIGCGIAGGAAGGAVTSLMKSAETGKFSVGGLIMDTLVGGAIGGLTAGLGAVLGPVLKAGAAWAGNAIKPALTSVVKTVTAKLQPMLSSATQRVSNAFRPAAQGASSSAASTTSAIGSGGGTRFIGNATGEVLDTTRVTIPIGKTGYLLTDPKKSGIYRR